jgi:CubicO group peptidase (beta-lactamase class C family)
MTARFSVPVVACLLALAAPARGAAPDDKALAAEINRAMKEWHVPGVAVVIVRDDKVIHLAGYGKRAAGRRPAVSADTIFPIASCSKAFTTAAMAILVDEKKLHWDDRVSKHLDWFHLSDPLADRDVRLRDLVCHRTGLASHDALFYRAPWKPEETVRRAGKLPLAKPFRTAFQYQSTMFTAAGLAAAAADKQSWPEMIHSRLLAPLGMKDTLLDSATALKREDVASGHQLDGEGDPVAMNRYVMAPDPAGSIHISARDMAKWLRFQLAGGVAEGKRLVSAKSFEEMHQPQMVMRQPPAAQILFPDTVQMSYGMGWVIYDHRGMKLLAHGGAVDGFRTQITLVPDKKLGIAVLSNLHQTPMNLALANILLDHVLGLPKRDWHALHRASQARVLAAAVERQKQRLAGRKRGTKPTLDLAGYAGTYEHPAYGTAKIEFRNGGLYWRWRDDESMLAHFHYDTFTVRAELAGPADITFALGKGGAVEGFAISGNLGIEFRKVAAK